MTKSDNNNESGLQTKSRILDGAVLHIALQFAMLFTTPVVSTKFGWLSQKAISEVKELLADF